MFASMMSGALGGLPSATRKRPGSPHPLARNVCPRFGVPSMTTESSKKDTFSMTLPERSVSREPRDVPIKEEPSASILPTTRLPEDHIECTNLKSNLSRLLQNSPDDEMYQQHVEAVVEAMCVQPDLDPTKSLPLEILSLVERSRAREDKKEQVSSMLTKGWLEKIFLHIGGVSEATGLGDEQAAMASKRMLMQTLFGTQAEHAVDNNNAKDDSEYDDDEDSSSASDGDTDVEVEREASLAPRGTVHRAPSARSQQAVAGRANSANANVTMGHDIVPYPLTVKRYKGADTQALTLLIRVGTDHTGGASQSVPKKADIKGSLTNMVKNSRHPGQIWSLESYQKGDYLVHFDIPEYAAGFANQSIKATGRRLQLEPISRKLSQIFTCCQIPEKLNYDRMLVSLTATRPDLGIYVAVGPPVPFGGKKKNKKKKTKKKMQRVIMVVFDTPIDIQWFQLGLGDVRANTPKLHFAASIEPIGCKQCGKSHVPFKCPKLQPLKLSSGRPLPGLLQAMPTVTT